LLSLFNERSVVQNSENDPSLFVNNPVGPRILQISCVGVNS